MGMMNLRRRVMDGKKSLPYDAEIEYLESNGTQYIDTGITVTENTPFEIDYFALNANQYLFGMLNSNYFINTGQNLRVWIGLDNSQFGVLVGQRHIIAFDGNTTIMCDGIVKSNHINKSAVNSEYSLVVYATRHPSYPSLIAYLSTYKLYKLKIGNVRDYIPVRIGTTGYLYDKVSGELNAGTGDFILGPDKN